MKAAKGGANNLLITKTLSTNNLRSRLGSIYIATSLKRGI